MALVHIRIPGSLGDNTDAQYLNAVVSSRFCDPQEASYISPADQNELIGNRLDNARKCLREKLERFGAKALADPTDSNSDESERVKRWADARRRVLRDGRQDRLHSLIFDPFTAAADDAFATCLRYRYRVHVSTDKRLYRPGDPIHWRAFVLHVVSCRPFPNAESGEIPYPEHVVSNVMAALLTGTRKQLAQSCNRNGNALRNGAIGGTIRTPATMSGGTHVVQVKVSMEFEQVVIIPPGEREIEIREYHTPRLQVSVDLSRASYAAGDQVVAVITVIRAEGGAPEGGRIQWTLKLGSKVVTKGDKAIGPGGVTLLQVELPTEIPDELGDQGTLVVSAEDGGAVETVRKTIPLTVNSEQLPSLSIQAFPEGGRLVPGVLNGLYVQAVHRSGKPCEVSVAVVPKGQDCRAVDTCIVTQHEGRGRGFFTPENRVEYELLVVKPRGTALRTALPAVDGRVSLVIPSSVFTINEPLAVQLGASVNISVLVRLYKLEWQICSLSATLIAQQRTEMALHVPDAFIGVLRATVWDASTGEPLAERLVFRRPPASRLLLSMTGPKQPVSPGSRVKVQVAATDASGQPLKATVGVTVTDTGPMAMTDPRDCPPDLCTMVYVEQELGKLADAAAYLSGPSDEFVPLDLRPLDLLLGTAGWRRFVYGKPLQEFIKANGDVGQRALCIQVPQEAVEDRYWQSYHARKRRQAELEEKNQTKNQECHSLFSLNQVHRPFPLRSREHESGLQHMAVWKAVFHGDADMVCKALVDLDIRCSEVCWKERWPMLWMVVWIWGKHKETWSDPLTELLGRLFMNHGAEANAAVHGGFWSHRADSKLQQSVVLDGCSEGGSTALHVAVELGIKTAVQVLLDHGANPMLRSHVGLSSLDVAASSGYSDILMSLLEACEEQAVDLPDCHWACHCNERGWTAFHYAGLSLHPAKQMKIMKEHASGLNMQLPKPSAFPRTDPELFTPALVSARHSLCDENIDTYDYPAGKSDDCDFRGYSADKLRLLRNAHDVFNNNGHFNNYDRDGAGLPTLPKHISRWGKLLPREERTRKLVVTRCDAESGNSSVTMCCREETTLEDVVTTCVPGDPFAYCILDVECMASCPLSVDAALPVRVLSSSADEDEEYEFGSLAMLEDNTFNDFVNSLCEKHVKGWIEGSCNSTDVAAVAVRLEDFRIADAWGGLQLDLQSSPQDYGTEVGSHIYIFCAYLMPRMVELGMVRKRSLSLLDVYPEGLASVPAPVRIVPQKINKQLTLHIAGSGSDAEKITVVMEDVCLFDNVRMFKKGVLAALSEEYLSSAPRVNVKSELKHCEEAPSQFDCDLWQVLDDGDKRLLVDIVPLHVYSPQLWTDVYVSIRCVAGFSDVSKLVEFYTNVFESDCYDCYGEEEEEEEKQEEEQVNTSESGSDDDQATKDRRRRRREAKTRRQQEMEKEKEHKQQRKLKEQSWWKKYNEFLPRFDSIWRRKVLRHSSFFQFFPDEANIDEMFLTEAESNFNDLISEFQCFQDATAEEEGEFDEEEGEYDYPPGIKTKQKRCAAEGDRSEHVQLSTAIGAPRITQSQFAVQNFSVHWMREFAHLPRHRKTSTRSDFVETVLFAVGARTLEATGPLKFKFGLGDLITRYRIRAEGYTDDGHLATAEIDFVAAKPFYIDYKLPFEVGAGDELHIPVVLANTSTETLTEAHVSLKHVGKGLFIDATIQPTAIQLLPKQRSRQVLQVSIGDYERGRQAAKVEIHGQAGEHEETVNRRMMIRPSGYPVLMTNATCLTAEERAITFTVNVPKLAPTPSSSAGTVSAQAVMIVSAASHLRETLEKLMSYPTGCLEQTCSAALPSILTLSVLRRCPGIFAEDTTSSASTAVTVKAMALLKNGVRNILKYRDVVTGGFCLYQTYPGSGRKSDIQTTAYALRVITEWQQEQPGAFEDNVFELAYDFLATQAGKNSLGWGWGYPSEHREQNPWLPHDETVTAHMCWCLLQGSRDSLSSTIRSIVIDSLNRLALLCQQLDDPNDVCSANPCITAQVVMCLLLLQDETGSSLLPLLDKFQGSDGACKPPASIDQSEWPRRWQTWMGSGGVSRTVESTAICAQVWLLAAKLNEASEDVFTAYESKARQALRWLHCNHRGSFWYSTSGTSAVIRTIVDWAIMHPPPAPGSFADWALEVFIDGTKVAETSIASKDSKIDFSSFVKEATSPSIELRLKEGTGHDGGFVPVAVSINFNTTEPELVAGTSAVLDLATQLSEGKESFVEGEVASLKVSICNKTDGSLGTVLAMIGLPGGVEVDVENMKEAVHGCASLDHFESKGRELRLYFSGLRPEQTLSISVDCICRIPGSYQGLPSQAFPYYHSEAVAWAAPLKATISVDSDYQLVDLGADVIALEEIKTDFMDEFDFI